VLNDLTDVMIREFQEAGLKILAAFSALRRSTFVGDYLLLTGTRE
jgi:hypothetical protein